MAHQPEQDVRMLIEYGGEELQSVEGFRLAAAGLQVWRSALAAGRLPVPSEFCQPAAGNGSAGRAAEGGDGEGTVWPVEPLFGRYCTALLELRMPTFAARHPELVTSALRSLVDMAAEFHFSAAAASVGDADDSNDSSQSVPSSAAYTDNAHVGSHREGAEHYEQMVERLVTQFQDEWAPPLSALESLDALFGPDHGLLTLGERGGGDTFGLGHGVWTHTGWAALKEIQTQVRGMKELRVLMRVLGRRASVEGPMHRLPFTTAAPNAPPAVARSPLSPTEATGLTRSGDLARLLPSELSLLARSRRDDVAQHVRRLLLAKLAERNLATYELNGWAEQPARPRRSLRRTLPPRVPTSTGGPVIVCLDTSWSMEGPRETLAKALVVEAVRAARVERRKCYLYAFAAGTAVAECELGDDAQGLSQLLTFLAFSFRGGTDVAAPLRAALERLTTEDTWASADILMVSDGELPTPPLDRNTMRQLIELKATRGLEVHGLLVGKSSSVPLEMICDQVHDFLNKYNPVCDARLAAAAAEPAPIRPGAPAAFATAGVISSARAGRSVLTTSLVSVFGGTGCARFPAASRAGSAARAVRALAVLVSGEAAVDCRWRRASPCGMSDGSVAGAAPARRPGRSGSAAAAPRPWASTTRRGQFRLRATGGEGGATVGGELGDASMAHDVRLEGLVQKTLAVAKSELEVAVREGHATAVETLVGDDDAQAMMSGVVDLLSVGLVERAVEVRLLVLAALSGEHLLLLGPPGTAKSELSRRLASLVDGAYFERLLTRFSVPEELFGPLSLAALERDEFLRNVSGYLPTATVAFLDEIFKANSTILNTLLTVLNERAFYNGTSRMPVPLVCLVAASNELPDSEELDALYDRFLLRRCVSPVSDDAVFDLLVGAEAAAGTACSSTLSPTVMTADASLASSELACKPGLDLTAIQRIAEAAETVVLPRDVLVILRGLRTYLRDEVDPPVYLSDRRLKKAAALLQTAAAAHGRGSVTVVDALLLQHVAWYQPEELELVTEWLEGNLLPASDNDQICFLTDGLFARALKSLLSQKSAAALEEVRAEVRELETVVRGKLQASQQHAEALRRMDLHLWSEPASVAGVQQRLLPAAEAAEVALVAHLARVMTLGAALNAAEAEPAVSSMQLVQEVWRRAGSEELATALHPRVGGSVGAVSTTAGSGGVGGLSDVQLQLSRKEARAQLSADEFLQWRKQKRGGGDEGGYEGGRSSRTPTPMKRAKGAKSRRWRRGQDEWDDKDY